MSHEFGFEGELSYRYRAPERIIRDPKPPWEGQDCPLCGTRLFHKWHTSVVLMTNGDQVSGVHDTCSNPRWRRYNGVMPARDSNGKLWFVKDSDAWIEESEGHNDPETTSDG